MKEIIAELISEKRIANSLLLEGKKYYDINIKELKQEIKNEKKNIKEELACVDGGSAIILETPNNVLSFNRIIGIWAVSKKIFKDEGYLLAKYDKEIIVDYFSKEKKDYKKKEKIELFRIRPEELDTKEQKLVVAVNIGRKLLEWRMIEKILSTKEPIKVLWDGSFTPQNKIEEEKIKQLIDKPIIGLAKKTTGLGINMLKTNLDTWEAIIKKDFFKSSFVKLHKEGKIFRADTLGNFCIEELIAWSNDPIFFGYPYPLILVDQLARISNQEKKALKIILEMSAGDNWGKISKESISNHEILDNIQY